MWAELKECVLALGQRDRVRPRSLWTIRVCLYHMKSLSKPSICSGRDAFLRNKSYWPMRKDLGVLLNSIVLTRPPLRGSSGCNSLLLINLDVVTYAFYMRRNNLAPRVAKSLSEILVRARGRYFCLAAVASHFALQREEGGKSTSAIRLRVNNK